MVSPLLQINDLCVDFVTESGTIIAVNHVSLQINRGETVAIVGESGSGKSVTALSILKLLSSPPARYRSGKILFSPGAEHTIDLLTQTPKQLQAIRGNQIGMIFQEPMSSLNPVLNCGSQVMEALRLHNKITSRESLQQTLDLFSQMKLPDPALIANRYPHQLSGGQKQRVMIALAMSCKPALLICDEPTTALDVTVQKTILQLIRELQQREHIGVLFITHDLGVVAEVADRAVVLFKGKVVEQGSVHTLFTNPQHPYTKALLNCRPLLHQKGERLPVVSDFMSVDETTGDIIEKKFQDQAKQTEPKQVSNPTAIAQEKLIDVQHLCIWYPSKKTLLGKASSFVKAVDDVSFSVFRGETLGLVGESGCGKTTLGRALLRLIPPTSGNIIYDGTSLEDYTPSALKKLRKDIQIVFQDPYSSLNPRLSIGAAIAEPLMVHSILSTRKERKERVASLLEKVNLKPEHASRYPHEFSGGQRQRIVIARALALNPSFIVCDESVSALDVSVQAQVLNLLNGLKKEFGFTVIFISHDLSVVRYISDRILVMNKGKIEEIGTADQVYYHPQQDYTKKLLAAIPSKKF